LEAAEDVLDEIPPPVELADADAEAALDLEFEINLIVLHGSEEVVGCSAWGAALLLGCGCDVIFKEEDGCGDFKREEGREEVCGV
jgi:hypothetical protein